jgi:hypothetical protein
VPVGDPADAVPEAEEEKDGDQRQQRQRRALGIGPLQPVLGEVADAVADGRGIAHQVAPQARQQRARQALDQVLGEERMAQHGDLLDQLARAYPGQLGRLYGSIERGGQRRQPCPLGGNRRRLGGRILCGLRPELLDLRFDGGQLRAQRLSGLGRVGQDALDIHAQPAQLLLELGQVLNGLLGGLDGGREPRNAIGNVGRQRHLRRRSFWGSGCCGLRWSGLWRLRRHRRDRYQRDEERGEETEKRTPKIPLLHSLTA